MDIQNMKPKIVAIVPARMQSKRLPGKVLLPLAGKPTLWWVIKRISLAKLVDEIVIATTTDNQANEPIFTFYLHKYDTPIPENLFINYFEYVGDEEDVIGRVLSAANHHEADIIVDITGDCPIIDPRHIDHLIKILLDDHLLDYTSNCIQRDWPDGCDIQVYWTDALMKVKRMFNPPNHVGWNIAQHPGYFEFYHLPAIYMHWPELGLTLDTPEDLDMLSRLFDRFSDGGDDPGFHIESIIRFLRMNPDWITNANVKRKTPEEG